MIYSAIGIMSGSSLDGLDIAHVAFLESGGNWNYEIKAIKCCSYSKVWKEKLQNASKLSAIDYQLLHAEYGHFIGEQINTFIIEHGLQYKIQLIASHGHTAFHVPSKKMTAQLGDGAAIAAITKLPVVSDLRSLDIAHGGQGAPVVPVGEKLLFKEYNAFLNIGGIANISFNDDGEYTAYDICPANRVLNMLAEELGHTHDDEGRIAASGKTDHALLSELNELDYYKKEFPKSLANHFGTETVYSMIKNSNLTVEDALRTYVEHICTQVCVAIQHSTFNIQHSKILATGGGALNTFLIQRLSESLKELLVEIIVPDEKLVNYKEAMIMALMGVLRWREEVNVFSSVTGAAQSSIGGALWMGS